MNTHLFRSIAPLGAFKQAFVVAIAVVISLSSCSSDDDDHIDHIPINDHGVYRDLRFDDIDVETVTYGKDGLQMDIYTPSSDQSTNRPVIVFAHGGAFVGGSKDLPDMQRLCNSFAKRGYVAASMSYRLSSDPLLFFDSLEVLSVVTRAMHDGKAAIRYFRKSAAENNPHGIDTNYIFGAGNSAGAIIMLHLAYMRNLNDIPPHLRDIIQMEGGLEGDRGNEGYSSRVHAVVNLAGAIHKLDYMQSGAPPLVSAHGDEDQTVPYDCDVVLQSFPSPEFRNTLCGSKPLHQRANDINIANDLLVFEGDDHCPWIAGGGTPTSKMDEVEQHVVNFLYKTFFAGLDL